jgi:hypothetical protein
MRILAIFCLPALLALAGCQTTAERQAREGAADNAACLSYGARRGSDAYVQCRTDLQRNRALDEIATRQQMDDAFGPYGGGPFFCRRRLWGPGCF